MGLFPRQQIIFPVNDNELAGTRQNMQLLTDS